MASFDLNDYVQVNERIELFYKKYPEGSIQTEIISNSEGQVIFKAYAYRTQDDQRPATGHAMEREGSSYINKTSHIENCETSAVGRALAMLGFEIKKSIASREEVANAKLNQKPETPKPKTDVLQRAKAIEFQGRKLGELEPATLKEVANSTNDKKIKTAALYILQQGA